MTSRFAPRRRVWTVFARVPHPCSTGPFWQESSEPVGWMECPFFLVNGLTHLGAHPRGTRVGTETRSFNTTLFEGVRAKVEGQERAKETTRETQETSGLLAVFPRGLCFLRNSSEQHLKHDLKIGCELSPTSRRAASQGFSISIHQIIPKRGFCDVDK